MHASTNILDFILVVAKSSEMQTKTLDINGVRPIRSSSGYTCD